MENARHKLKPEHKAVLTALEATNAAHSRASTVGEVARAVPLVLPARTVKLLEKSYVGGLDRAVWKILSQLHARGVVFSPGRVGRNRYYGSEHVLAPECRELPPLPSRRRVVLELVRGAAKESGRPVRIDDVVRYASGRPEAEDLTPELITRDVLNLKSTGELRIAASTTRGDERGRNLYLPADVSDEVLDGDRPPTWMEEVWHAFEELWAEHVAEAAAGGRLPRPISTGEVRQRMQSAPIPHERLKNPQLLPNAMIQLTRSKAALLRKVKRRGQKASLWAPLGVPDEGLDVGDAYASDAERAGAAVRRSVERLGRPVTIRDVEEEVRLDSTLRPAGSSDLHKVLADTSKESIAAGKGRGRCGRVLRRIYKVGRAEGMAYYHCDADRVADARFYVGLAQIKTRWDRAGATEELAALEQCSLASLAVGRAMLIAADVRAIVAALERLLGKSAGEEHTRDEALKLADEARAVEAGVREWVGLRKARALDLPSDVSPNVPTWTAEELLKALRPVYPLARQTNDPNRLIRLLHGEVRRVPNPEFRNRFSNDPRESAEYLFDSTDALLYAAKRWGGRECSMQAMLADRQIGRLRDVRFVFPALESKNFEERLVGVACLAFLWTAAGNGRLLKAAEEDPSPTVREAGLWACGFAGAEGAYELLGRLAVEDPDPGVREFAGDALGQEEFSWWAI